MDFKHTLGVEWLDLTARTIPKQQDWLTTVIPLTKQRARSLGIIDAVVSKYEEGIKKGATFSKSVVKTRNFQQAFRNIILNNYSNQCVVCDVNDVAFLRGCHIVPVWKDHKHAADPENGICLCVLHDVAFEKGIFSISDDYKVILSGLFKPSSTVLSSAILSLNGKKIRLPVKQPPGKAYLKRHRVMHKS